MIDRKLQKYFRNFNIGWEGDVIGNAFYKTYVKKKEEEEIGKQVQISILIIIVLNLALSLFSFDTLVAFFYEQKKFPFKLLPQVIHFYCRKRNL